MAILSEKRQKCFGLRRKDVRMRAIICDDDGRFAKKLEQLIIAVLSKYGDDHRHHGCNKSPKSFETE